MKAKLTAVTSDKVACVECGTVVGSAWDYIDAPEVACADCLPDRRRKTLDQNGWNLVRGIGQWQRDTTVVPPRYNGARIADLGKSLRGIDVRATGVYLYGNPGSGKSHAAAALAFEAYVADAVLESPRNAEWWRPRFVPKWANVPALLERVRRSFDAPTVDPLAALRDCPVLVLDDLGAEKPTEWVREQLYSLVNERYEQELPIVVTSNHAPSALAARVGQRVASRLQEMCEVFGLDHADRRAGK